MTLTEDITAALRAIEALDKRISAIESIHADIPITHRYHRSDDEWQYYREAREATAEERRLRLLKHQAQFGYTNDRHNDNHD